MVAACIVYLVRGVSDDLLESLRALRVHFLDHFPYPVLLFHENLTIQDAQFIEANTGVHVRLVHLPHFLDIPPHLEFSLQQIQRWNQGLDGGRASGLGYIQMCRFFSYELYHHPVVAPFDYYWRFDDDSVLLSTITTDPFQQMEDHQWVYGYRCIEYENPKEIRGLQELWLTTQQFAQMHQIPIQPAKRLVCKSFSRYTGMNYYNNFEINKVAFWRRHSLYTDYFRFLDSQGGFFRYRWGDANVRAMAVGLFLQPKQIHGFLELGYRHNYHYAIPANDRIIYCEERDPFRI